MRIVVCLKEVIEPSLNLGFGQISNNLVRKGLTYRLNPDDIGAFNEALILKDKNGSNSEIIAITVGPEGTEKYLREALTLGATKAIRIWEEGFIDLSSYQKAKILSRTIAMLDADLILIGAKSLDTANSQIGPYLAAWLNIPCICEASEFHLDGDKKDGQCITVTRNISRGNREKVFSALPAVITVVGHSRYLSYANLEKLLDSQDTPITRLSINEIGVTPAEIDSDPTKVVGLSIPRPRAKKVPYDSSLPAFYRILALLQGGITKRRGEMLRGDREEMINQLFELLVKEEIIKPAVKT